MPLPDSAQLGYLRQYGSLSNREHEDKPLCTKPLSFIDEMVKCHPSKSPEYARAKKEINDLINWEKYL